MKAVYMSAVEHNLLYEKDRSPQGGYLSYFVSPNSPQLEHSL